MITFLLALFILNTQVASPQTSQMSVNDLFTYFDSDIAKIKSAVSSKGYKISYDGDKFGKVQFYQWYRGRTSYSADAFLQRYKIPENEEYNWYDDCLEYITYNPDEFSGLKKQCEAVKMKLVNSGQKEFTYEDSYIRDPGTFSVYQNEKYWLHFNTVQEADKVAFKLLLRKRPSF
jgi:hypothetical protein